MILKLLYKDGSQGTMTAGFTYFHDVHVAIRKGEWLSGNDTQGMVLVNPSDISTIRPGDDEA